MIRIFLTVLLLVFPAAAAAEDTGSLVPPPQSGFVPDNRSKPDGSSIAPVQPEPPTVGTIEQKTSEAPEVQDVNHFTSPKGGFSISYPSGWFPVDHPSMAFQVRPSLDSLFVLRVQVSKAPKGATAESYARAQIKRFGKFWVPEIEETAVLGGGDAWRLRHVQMIEGRMTRAEKLFAIHNGRAFMVDCQTNPSSFPALEPICAAAASSFRFSGN